MAQDNRMIGRRGEKTFSLLCSESEVTCNASGEDDFGWDAFIEFPARSNVLISPDMQEPGHSAKIQLKATTRSSLTVSIRLST
jgi:hypothetical protein